MVVSTLRADSSNALHWLSSFRQLRAALIALVCMFVVGCAHQAPISRPSKPQAQNTHQHHGRALTGYHHHAARYYGPRYYGPRRHDYGYHRPTTGEASEEAPPEKPTPTGAEAPNKPAIKGLVPVYFATNREVMGGPNLQLKQITYDRSATNTYGCVTVSIPIVHKMGEVETPKTYLYGIWTEAEQDGKHFRIQTLSKLSREEFASAIANPADSLMLFVHGYNVPFSDAAFKAAQIAFDANYKGRVMIYSWPSKGGLADYDYDRESALHATDGLFDLLKLIKTEGNVSRIILIAHSLGSEVVLGALQQAALSQTALGITELIFAAPDVDRDLYLERANQIKAAAGAVTVYASSTDLALLASMKKAQSKSRMGYVTKSGPTLVSGIETIDVSAVGSEMFALNHSTYSTSRAVLDDIGRIISSSSHLKPPQRTPTLRSMPNELNATYWMYPY
ncbi:MULTISPECIES: alpha/beta hydrolase [Bradyrhizobium]|uniref:Alpha/beta fold hydrolase n=3 Tax=Bradyrhizobium TaxID=374 RepID=A0AAE6CCG3_9BRAD|nr:MULTISPECIES: alpha/beta hydrolase [Bradyrhizobium]MCG2628267.1 alpha/beta hydrolase [Bradyrhizobium zhengyangense]MCG2643386.1 alpha/beta hydrolase [Bradyrhizobium zhengyangense]MCG2670300.1 alpha/beta hydrolase [Bradyrhizobium zhengyangense]MDN4985966.1 alpha/beta hydrolase [Bradyrhizobium sp. WYCCWR 13022]MDN5002654.1 alpha/beta hydrolase [Bradyrhizobium sp. WYCCWR 12677]